MRFKLLNPHYYTIGIGTLVMLCFYQNFTQFRPPMRPLNNESRINHSRELLGAKYKGSFAQKAEKKEDLNLAIYSVLYENLPSTFKNRAVHIAQTITDESEFYDVDPILVLAMIKTESKFNPTAVGSAGEIGLMQVKPDTAEWISKKESIPWEGTKTLEDPIANVKIGMAYINYLRVLFDGAANKYLSAYNMGAKNVMKLYSAEQKPQDYSDRVLKNYENFYSQFSKPVRLPTMAESL